MGWEEDRAWPWDLQRWWCWNATGVKQRRDAAATGTAGSVTTVVGEGAVKPGMAGRTATTTIAAGWAMYILDGADGTGGPIFGQAAKGSANGWRDMCILRPENAQEGRPRKMGGAATAYTMDPAVAVAGAGAGVAVVAVVAGEAGGMEDG